MNFQVAQRTKQKQHFEKESLFKKTATTKANPRIMHNRDSNNEMKKISLLLIITDKTIGNMANSNNTVHQQTANSIKTANKQWYIKLQQTTGIGMKIALTWT